LTANELAVGDGWDAEMTAAGDQPAAANTAAGFASRATLKIVPTKAGTRDRPDVIMVRLPLEQRMTAEPSIAAKFSQSGKAAMAEIPAVPPSLATPCRSRRFSSGASKALASGGRR
jgi:hypothetical protein